MATDLELLKQIAEKAKMMREVQVLYFAAVKEDRATGKADGKHFMWKSERAKELLSLSRQLEGELDRLITLYEQPERFRP